MPRIFTELASNIYETGYVYKIPEMRLRKRSELGLPPLPKASLDKVDKLIELAGARKLLKSKESQ
jgi:hypothetical protein